ncbi:unnamed protein product, partial [Heterotrigona itama]
EIAAILISFQRHAEWQSREVKVRPRSGSMLLYSRKKVRYRRDGYCWKKRKDGKTTREDHMKLKVQGVECIYGCYVHSAILPTFHRRCYWLLQNPDVVLVHYLNVPYPDGDAKLAALPPCLALPPDKKEWTRDELASQLRPMFLGGDDDPNNPHLTQHSNHPVDMIVSQLLDRQRASSTSSTTSTQLAPRRLTPDNQVTEQQIVQQTSVDREQQTQQDIDAQESMDRSAVQSLPIGGTGPEVTDFAETLDLSQEDIQRTLSANMVPPSPSPSPADNSMINPMDFIDSSDDVLVNLDAFDVFGDLPELHDFEAEQSKAEERGGSDSDVGCHPGTTVHIAEYSPEWSYTEGGVKVLVAGPWTGGSNSQSYSVLFDAEPVEACLVQPGVLRCRCPAHAPGIASLQVACDGFVVSDSVAFEYRRAPTTEPSPERALLDRLADVESRLQGPGPPSPAAHLEERLVAYCQVSISLSNPALSIDSGLQKYSNARKCSNTFASHCTHVLGSLSKWRLPVSQDAVVRPWRAGAEPLQSGGPTLLHLAAGLGYSRLACALLHWRAENPSSVLDAEVDALRQDSAGLTPLAWACAAGHADTARILYRFVHRFLETRTRTEYRGISRHSLYSDLSGNVLRMSVYLHRWNAMALRVRDCQNRTATELAAENGHTAIAEELNRLEARRQDERLFLRPASPSPRRPSQDSGLDLALC